MTDGEEGAALPWVFRENVSGEMAFKSRPEGEGAALSDCAGGLCDRKSTHSMQKGQAGGEGPRREAASRTELGLNEGARPRGSEVRGTGAVTGSLVRI